MESLKSTEFKVGLTVILSTAILVIGIILGKGFKFEPDKIKIRVKFDNIGGMVPGDPVTINGLRAGKVLDIYTVDRDVVTLLEVSDQIQLYEDASFIVVSAELLAGMRVEISPGQSNEKINMARQPFQGKYGGRIVDVGLTIDALAQNLSGLTFKLDTTVYMINTMLRKGDLQKNISTTVSNLDNVSSSLRTFINSNSKNMSSAIASLEGGANKFNAIMDSNKTSISSSIQNIDRISTRLDTVSTSLQLIISQIQNRKGTLGKMVNDTTLYQNLNSTLVRIDSLARQIKEDGLNIDLF
jgi:phospholipid/cholesterol/gamma-HCH transport system substrate-binding protein